MGVFLEGIFTIVGTAIIWCWIMSLKAKKEAEEESKIRSTQEKRLENNSSLENLAEEVAKCVNETVRWQRNAIELIDNQKVYVMIKVKEHFSEVSMKKIDHEMPSGSNFDLRCHLWLMSGSTYCRTIKYEPCGFDRIAPEERDAMVNVFARKLASKGIFVVLRFTDDKFPVLVADVSYCFPQRGSKSLLS